MDLIEPYVNAVRLFLPNEQREDIAAELSEDLRSQMAEKEAALGRPLTEEEQAALLKQYGHPMLMASRYRPVRYLIGPVLFPHYLVGLKVFLVFIGLTQLFRVFGALMNGPSLAELGALAVQVAQSLWWAAVIVTVIAVLIDRALTRSKVFENWDPRSVGRPARLAARAAERAARHAGGTPGFVHRLLKEAGPPFRVRSAAQFIVLLTSSVCGLLALWSPIFVASTEGMLEWAPVVGQALPVLVVVFAAVLVDQYLRLIQSENVFVRFMRIVWANSGWILVVLLLIADHQWVVWVGNDGQWDRYGVLFEAAGRTWSIVDVANHAITAALLVVTLACLVGPVWRLRGRLHRRTVRPAVPNPR